MKKIISIFLALVFAVGCAIPSYAASGKSANGVSNVVRTIDGLIESLERLIRSKTENRKNYAPYTELCDIPETENGYVPQGFCISEDGESYIISYYHSEKASIIVFVNAETGESEKLFKLKAASGKDFTGHAGGIAQENGWLYICHGSKIYRVAFADIVNAENGGEITLSESVQTDVKCSYINSDGEYLYAGEFYTFDFDGAYDTETDHHVSLSLFERHYARCNAYKLSDFEAAFESGELIPEFAVTTPNRVQGFARLDNDNFVLSISYGRNNDSFMYVYDNVVSGEPDYELAYGEENVPVYHLSNSRRNSNLRQPPMLEGIDANGNSAIGIFESGAKKYSDSAFIVNSVCELF
ncbi:MAG: hypothetical protein J6R20_06985 [Clostridia bacterium]|nr:hypothetical protein [Clostridia bacterium]